MQTKNNIFHEFWNTPFPEFFVNKTKTLFQGINLPSTELDPKDYLTKSGIIAVVSIVSLIILSGTFNPLDLLFEVPYLSAGDYLATISNWTNFTWTEYLVFSSICITIVLWIIQTFVFHKQEVKVLSVEGIVNALMTVVVAMLVDYICQDIFRIFHEAFLTETLRDPATLLTAIAANFGLFFILQDAFTNQLSFSLTPMICKSLKLNLFGLGLIQFILVSAILKVVLTILEKIGIWDLVIDFIEKWIYTPKYMCLIVIWFYFFAILLLLKFVFPDIYKSLKYKYLKR